MKTMHTFLALILFLLVLSQAGYSGNAAKAKANFNSEVVIENLINGVESEYTGLQVSAAQMLGDLRADESVIPLLRLFNNSENSGVKIAAALSLLKIGDERGIKAIKYSALYADDPHVKNMCHRFYQCYTENIECE